MCFFSYWVCIVPCGAVAPWSQYTQCQLHFHGRVPACPAAVAFPVARSRLKTQKPYQENMIALLLIAISTHSSTHHYRVLWPHTAEAPRYNITLTLLHVRHLHCTICKPPPPLLAARCKNQSFNLAKLDTLQSFSRPVEHIIKGHFQLLQSQGRGSQGEVRHESIFTCCRIT